MPNVSSRKFQKQFYVFTLLGVLLLALGAVGVGLSQWEHRHIISDEITYTETYVDYETQTKIITETYIIARASRLVSPPVGGADQPSEQSWHEVFPFNLDPKCKNYRLSVNASEAIYLTAILTSDDFVNGFSSLEGITLEGHLTEQAASVPVKAWVGTKRINETLDLAPGAYLLYFSAASALETSFSFHFEIIQDCMNVVTETVPVEKTREVTQRLDRWVTSKPYENLLWPALISIALGSGVLAYGVSMRKRAPVTISKTPIDDMSCDEVRREKDALVEEINRLNKERDKVAVEAKERWEEYVKLDREAREAKKAELTANEIRLLKEKLEKDIESAEVREFIYESALKNPDPTITDTVKKELEYAREEAKKKRDDLATFLEEVRKASEETKNSAKKAGDAKNASEKADKSVEDLDEEIRKYVARLKKLISQKRHCIDCDDIESLYNETSSKLGERENACKALQDEADQYKVDANNASIAKEAASQEAQKCKDDGSYKEAVDEAKKKLKDFIDKGLSDDRITTNLEKVREKRGKYRGSRLLGAGFAKDVRVYVKRDRDAQKLFDEYIKNNKQNLGTLAKALKDKMDDLENHEQECKKKQEKADREQREAECAKILAERANARSERCQKTLDDLKNQADFFKEQAEKCFNDLKEDLKKCRDNIANLISEIEGKRNDLDSCLKDLEGEIKKLGELNKGARENAKKYADADLESISRELDSAIKKHEECRNRLTQNPKAQQETESDNNIEDCRRKEKALEEDLENLEKHLEECQGCCSRAAKDVGDLTKSVDQRELRLKCYEEFLRWIAKNLVESQDPDLWEGALAESGLKKPLADAGITTAGAVKDFVGALAQTGRALTAGAMAVIGLGYAIFVSVLEKYLRGKIGQIKDEVERRRITALLNADEEERPCGAIKDNGKESHFFFRTGDLVFIYEFTPRSGLRYLGRLEMK